MPPGCEKELSAIDSIAVVVVAFARAPSVQGSRLILQCLGRLAGLTASDFDTWPHRQHSCDGRTTPRHNVTRRRTCAARTAYRAAQAAVCLARQRDVAADPNATSFSRCDHISVFGNND